MDCDRCGKVFSSKYTLATHMKNSKTCGENNEYVCEMCTKRLSSKNRLMIHIDTCKANTDRKELTNAVIAEYKLKIESLEKQLKSKTDQLNAIEERKKCIKPLDFNPEAIRKKFIANIDYEYIKQGQRGIARFIVTNILCDESGDILYRCTDKDRQKFVYYDTDGKRKYDYKAETLIHNLQLSKIFHHIYQRVKQFYNLPEEDIDIDKLTDMTDLMLDLANIQNPEFNQDFRRTILMMT